MLVRLLGPIEVSIGEAARAVPGLRRRAVLAALALHHGQAVSAEWLIDVVWDGAAPMTAANSLQSHISYLRREFGLREAIKARPPGYVLDLPTDEVDVSLCERLIREGRRANNATESAEKLRAALGYWRGRPLADTAGLSWLDGQANRLEALRTAAIHALAEARLALGEHVLLVPELESLTAKLPFDEELHRLLMLALYRCGRQTDALATYHALKRRLKEDLGMDPSRSIRDLESGVLRHESWLTAPPTLITLPPPAPAGLVPAQLPAAITGFVGRHDEIALLDEIAMWDETRASATVVAISGTAGVGKTALAVHWAHRIAHRFPDGQLYADLRGYSAAEAVVTVAEAVRGFLETLGVPAQQTPLDLEAQIALYRAILADRRVLVVLDNIRDLEHVRRLLPDAPRCLALLTSREQLTGLERDGEARRVVLDLLDAAQSRNLLGARLRTTWVTEDPAVDAIVEYCAGLPLALAIVAARAAIDREVPLNRYAAEMAEAKGALDLLDGGDDGSNLRAVFSWSVGTLSPPAARLFRRLGLHPGPDFSTSVAASIAGVPLRQTELLLAELHEANLLTRHAGDSLGHTHGDRYALHDLLRAYAAERAVADEGDDDRLDAIERMCDHYLQVAHRAAVLLGADHPISLRPPRSGVAVVELNDYAAAMAWLAAERNILVNVAAQALSAGLDTYAWQLAWALRVYLGYQGLWHEQATVQQIAVTAARRIADPYALGHSLRGLAYADAALGRHQDASVCLRLAVDSFGEAARADEQALSLLSLSRLLDGSGDFKAALGNAKRALTIYEASNYLSGKAYALNAIGWCHARLGNHNEALDHCEQALALHRDLGNQEGESFTRDSLGYIHHHRGDYQKAIKGYREAVALFRERGDRASEADACDRLGDSYAAIGDPASAGEAWRRALRIHEQLGEPDRSHSDRIRAKLAIA